MVVWGLNVPVLKILVENLSPVTMTAFRILVAGLTVFIILAYFKLVRLPTSKEWVYILFGSFFNVVCHHFFLSMGLKGTNSTNAGLILGAGPILTALIATFLIRRKISVWKWLGFVLGGIGVSLTILIGSKGISGVSLGNIFVFLSILTQAFSFVLISKAARTLDPRLLTGYMLVIGSGILIVIGLILEPEGFSAFVKAPAQVWLYFFSSAILATAAGHMTYNFIIGKIGPAEAAVFLNIPPFITLIGSAIMLDETITSLHIVGLFFIVTGVLLGSGALEEMMKKRRLNGLRGQV